MFVTQKLGYIILSNIILIDLMQFTSENLTLWTSTTLLRDR